MKTKHTTLTAMIGVFLLVLAGVPLANAQKFNFTTINVQNASSTVLGGVANDGKLVGSYRDQKGVHGFLQLPDGTQSTIDCPVNACPNAVGTSLHRIDSLGEMVAGHWTDGTFLHQLEVEHGLVIELSSNNTVVSAVNFDFPSQLEVIQTFVNGINTSGEISGGYIDADSAGNLHEHGFTANLSLGQVAGFKSIDIGTLGTEFGNVNDSGEIVGFYVAANGKVISFLCRNSSKCAAGIFTTLSSPSGAAVFARGINNLQQVVGFDSNSIALPASLEGASNGFSVVPGSTHGFFLSSPTGRATPVNFPGPDAQGTGVGSINDSGTIAGQYNSPDFVTHGFVAMPTN
jgi:hypothetical protein